MAKRHCTLVRNKTELLLNASWRLLMAMLVISAERMLLPIRCLVSICSAFQTAVSSHKCPSDAAHLVYLRGESQHRDLYYARAISSPETFSAAIRVNHSSGSAISIGTIRGAHVAAGRSGRIHVAWMGSDRAEPCASGSATPMLYTRLDAASSSFEPERNVIREHVGLDGGGSVAVDTDGNVYVIWHPPDLGHKGEANRRVWIARSTEDGATLAPERRAFDAPTGVCSCCGLRTLADHSGSLFIL